MTKTESSYFKKVYAIVQQIPEGRVSSYGAIAEYLGMRGGARMVGWAMNQSHSAGDFVPAHRVVNKNGMLTGKHHFGRPGLMQELLENEGIKVKEDQIQNYDKHFWDPGKNLQHEKS